MAHEHAGAIKCYVKYDKPIPIVPDMDQPDLIALGQQAGTLLGARFAEYSWTFANRDRPARVAAFAADAQVILRDHRSGTIHDCSPVEFFDRLEEQVGSARFILDAYTARFDAGYLFADGLWVQPSGEPVLRAADLFIADPDGCFAYLEVVWTAPS